MDNLNATTLIAISKLAAKAANKARKDVEPGEYRVAESVTLDLNATVKVFEDEDYIPTADIPLKTALALFVRYSGCTGEAGMAALVRAMKEAHEINQLDDPQAKIDAIGELADLERAEGIVREGLAELPPKTRRGKVTCKGECTGE